MYISSALFLAAVACGLVAIHPFTTYPLSLMLVKFLSADWGFLSSLVRNNDGSESVRRSYQAEQLEYKREFPSIGICVSVYNGAASATMKLRNILELVDNYPGDAHAYIYDDCSDDGTKEILQSHSGLISLTSGERRLGKSAGMNALLSKCHDEIVVFTDANVRIGAQSLTHIARHFEDSEIGCVCGTLIYEDVEDAFAARTNSLYWRIEEKIKELETETGSAMGADGSMFAIRRSLHRPVPNDIIDDMYTSFSILCDGFRIVRSPDAVCYERAAQESAEEFDRKKRIACRSFNCYRLLRVRINKLSVWNRYKFYSHKWIRWTTIFWIIASLFFLGLALSRIFGIASTVGFYAISALALRSGYELRFPGCRQLFEILAAFVSSGIGVFQSLRGKRYQTWKPPATAYAARNKGDGGPEKSKQCRA